MKYTLYIITIIFFSFGNANAGSADNKGLDCMLEIVEGNNDYKKNIGKKERKVFWFNNGKVVQAGVNDFSFMAFGTIKPNIYSSSLSYSSKENSGYIEDLNSISWSTEFKWENDIFKHTWDVDRETLKISHEFFTFNFKKYRKNMDENELNKIANYFTEVGTCKVFEDFSIVEQYFDKVKKEMETKLKKNKI